MEDKFKQQAQQFADKVMSMNRHERRKFASLKGMPTLAGTNTPYVKVNQTRKEVR